MSFPELNIKKPDFLKTKFEMEYFVFALACAGLLVIVVALPYVSIGYGVQRLYPLAIVILSVCFVLGGMTLSNLSLKKKALPRKRKEGRKGSQVRAYLIILLILIPYSMFETSAIGQLFGASSSIILNSEGEAYDSMYIHDQDSYGAKWLKSNTNEKAKIYGDFSGTPILVSQGLIHKPVYARSFIEDKEAIKDGYIYLRYYNVVKGKLSDKQYEKHNITEYQDKFVWKDKIYSNGGSEVWR